MFFRPDTRSSTLRFLALPTGLSQNVHPMLRYIENICLLLAVIVRNLEAVQCDGGVFMSEEWDGIRRSALVTVSESRRVSHTSSVTTKH